MSKNKRKFEHIKNLKTVSKKVTLATNQTGEKVLKITFPYNVDTLFQVRSLPGRKYHVDEVCWSAPVFPKIIQQLISWGFIIDESVTQFMQAEKVRSDYVSANGKIKGLRGILKPFQSECVSFIENRDGRALIADEMGLGKTIETLGWIQLHPEKRPVIFVVPKSAKLNWKKEIESWLPEPDVEVLTGEKAWRITGEFIILNYDILHAWINELKKINAQILVTDECHLYKNSKAKRTSAIKKLGKGIPHILALSGTPIVNRPVEIFNAVNLIDAQIFPSYWDFTERYCARKHTNFGWDVSGSSNTQELHSILSGTIMIRRLKKDVLTELPDKIFSFVPMELRNEKEYQNAENNFISYLTSIKKNTTEITKIIRAEQLAKIEILKQLAIKGKLPDVIDWIDNFIETGQKLVVFATHKFVIDALMEHFGKVAVKIDGSVGETARQKAENEFQTNPKITLFVGNIQAAGTVITLTASSNVAFIEFPWTPGELKQAMDRVHRIGQKECVNVYYLLAQDTIDEKIARILDEKQKVLNSVHDGIETETNSLLIKLIQEYETN